MSTDYDPTTLLLDYYHCTFFLPLIGLTREAFVPNDEYAFSYSRLTKPRDREEEAQAQAYRYFSPALRNILFDTGLQSSSNDDFEPLKEWRLNEKDIESWYIHLGKKEHQDDPSRYQIAKVVSINLYRYFNGIYLLAFRVEPEALRQLRTDKKCPLFDGNASGKLQELILKDPGHEALYRQLHLESWLRFTRLARLIYPTFPEQNDEKKIAPIHLVTEAETITAFKNKQKVRIHEKRGEDFSPVIRNILERFSKKPDKLKGFIDKYTQLYDDRMFVSVAYGLVGSDLSESERNKILYLAAYVDRHADTFDALDGHVYAPDEIEGRLRPQTFGLWKGLGGQYAYTDFSNAYVYCGWDFRSYIAPHHIPFIYDRMLIQALLYQASLRHYDNCISALTPKMLQRRDLKATRDQRGQFIRFTNQYWFHHLTEQMQGKEIFRLQQQALGLKQHYEILKDELERTDEYQQTEHEIRVLEFSGRLTRWGLTIALIAIYYSVLPILNEFFNDIRDKAIWTCIGTWIKLPYVAPEVGGLIFLLIFIPFLILLGIIFVIKLDRFPIK